MRMRRAMKRRLRRASPVKNLLGAPTNQPMDDPTSTPRRRSFPSREAFVWLYVVALAVVGAGVWGVFIHGESPHADPHLPWWAVALGFAFAEVCVVHVRFRRSAHSFSLADLPFVFGLVFASGDDFVLGAIIGTAIVHGLIRRLEPVKLLFNLAQLALATTLAAATLH